MTLKRYGSMPTDDTKLAVDAQAKPGAPSQETPVENITPLIVDSGRRSRKSIRLLKEGRGKLMDEVTDIIGDIRSTRGASSKEIVPIIIIVRQKRRRSKVSLPLIPSPLDFLR